ncbi:discoidin domain-containing protein [Mycobacterium sp. SM1]|uniref:discoidin domain-containing protein n=1 Tax=Mycobacterium sp. SM1 TaxID=2816243 RepID=UPI001F427DEF|nr:discoidin domain-containing protein [Mycobacterium sp. SM1]
MSTRHDLQTDHSWENRRLILSSLAPRTATRPARRSLAETPATTADAQPKKASLLTRSLHASKRAARAAGQQFNKRVPPERRMHTAIITAAAVVLLLVALAAVNYLTADIRPQSNTTTTTAATPPTPTPPPLRNDTIIKGLTAADMCPRDVNYSDANRAFDGDFNTAWVCTRVKNQDGQIIQVDFSRQVTITQVRAISGFDAIAPDGTDQWSKHRIVTQLEVWFPKDLKRDPVTIDTGGARDWRSATINPPATVSKLLIRVKETSDPPHPATATTETTSASPDNVTTVAISEIQFIGTLGTASAPDAAATTRPPDLGERPAPQALVMQPASPVGYDTRTVG